MKADLKTLLRRFLIELALYAVLVVIYLFLVLRTLLNGISQLFESNPVAYAFVALALVFAQGWLLETFTSFLLERLGLE